MFFNTPPSLQLRDKNFIGFENYALILGSDVFWRVTLNTFIWTIVSTVVAFVLEKWAPKTAFVSILGVVLVGMLLSWLVSLAAHVSFRRRISPEQLASLPLRSPLGAWGSALGFILIIISIFETNSRVALISGAVFMIVVTLAYWWIRPRRALLLAKN